MSVIQVSVQLTPQDLRKAAEQLETTELDNLVNEMLLIRARRRAPVLRQKETTLLKKINRGLTPEAQSRYQELLEKLQDETITDVEHEALIHLTQEIESLNAARLTHLVELAQLRQVPLAQLIDDLGLNAPNYV